MFREYFRYWKDARAWPGTGTVPALLPSSLAGARPSLRLRIRLPSSAPKRFVTGWPRGPFLLLLWCLLSLLRLLQLFGRLRALVFIHPGRFYRLRARIPLNGRLLMLNRGNRLFLRKRLRVFRLSSCLGRICRPIAHTLPGGGLLDFSGCRRLRARIPLRGRLLMVCRGCLLRQRIPLRLAVADVLLGPPVEVQPMPQAEFPRYVEVPRSVQPADMPLLRDAGRFPKGTGYMPLRTSRRPPWFSGPCSLHRRCRRRLARHTRLRPASSWI